MLKSRNELRRSISRLDDRISLLHMKYPSDRNFISHTDGIFLGVLSQVVHEDEEWAFNLIDLVCTRHGIPYPAM